MPDIVIETKTTAATDGLTALVTVDNEQRLNCLDSALARKLAEVFQDLAQEPALRTVCLRGAGQRAFIGGADIREMVTLNPDTARDFISTLHQACAAIRDLPVPVIARISGYCFGAGLEIAASCDLRIADTTAVFAMPEVQIGLPSVIEAALLPRLIGWGRAARLVYTGEHLEARTASDWGLVDQLTAPEQLAAGVKQTLAAIVQADSNAIRMQKQLLREWACLPTDEAIRHSIDRFPRAFDDAAPNRRMQAFLNRKG